jgi:hypothetical protein
MTIKLRKLADGSLEHFTESTVTPAQLAARAEQMLQNVKSAERVVTREFLTPRKPGASSSEVKAVRVGPKQARQYAATVPHFVAAHIERITAEDELLKLQAQQKDLEAVIADPATSDQARVKAQLELVRVTDMVARLETALHPAPTVDQPPTAGQARQYAPAKPHYETDEGK